MVWGISTSLMAHMHHMMKRGDKSSADASYATKTRKPISWWSEHQLIVWGIGTSLMTTHIIWWRNENNTSGDAFHHQQWSGAVSIIDASRQSALCIRGLKLVHSMAKPPKLTACPPHAASRWRGRVFTSPVLRCGVTTYEVFGDFRVHAMIVI